MNPFETPNTYRAHKAEYLFGLAVVTGLMVYHIGEVRWWVAVGLFFYIDVIGYLPGALAYKRAGGGPIHKGYYIVYNVMHSMVTQGAVVLLWCLTIGPEWALLVIPFHLFADRGLFGNFLKPLALPFEPVAHPAYQEMLDKLGIHQQAPLDKHAAPAAPPAVHTEPVRR